MFKVRTSLPELGHPFYNTAKNDGMSKCVQGKMKGTGKPYKGLDVLGNCVGWVNGRVNEAIGEDKMKYQFICNAESFVKYYVNAGYKLELSQTPVEGSVMIWKKGEISGDDGAGHVAYVEKVYNIDEVFTSESGWNNKNPMWNKTRSKGEDGNWGMKEPYEFMGFMIIPELVPKPEPEPEPEPTPKPEPTPEPKPTEIKKGDTVIVNGVGTASSDGTGAKTGVYKNKKCKVIKIKKGAKNPYALNRYNKNSGVTAWFNAASVKKV